MRRFPILLLACLAGAPAAAAPRTHATPPGAARLPGNAEFSLHSMWDAGKAEISLYRTTGQWEGAPRVYETRIVVVKEDFRKETLAKVEPPATKGTFEGLEMNYSLDVPTGTEDHHQAVSVLFDRRTFRPLRLDMASVETDGVTFVTALPLARSLQHVSHSFWDGDRTRTIPWSDNALFYDALPVWLRSLDLATPATYDIQLLPTQLSSHVQDVTPVPAHIVVAGHEGAPSMTSRGGYRVEVTFAGKEDRLWFHPGPGHTLMVWEKSDGSVLTLKKNVWLPYWEKTKPGDEAVLE